MVDLTTPYVDILLFAGALSIILGIYIWRRQNIPGRTPLVLSIFAVVIWTLTVAFEVSTMNVASKILWTRIEYIGVVNLPPSFLLFVLIYTGRLKKPELTKIGFLWLIPIIVLLFAWTNEWHHLVWTGFSDVDPITQIMIYSHGPVFWLALVYNYVIAICILILLIIEFRKTTHTKYRWQIAMMMLAGIFPVLSGLIYIIGLNPAPGLDWTPIGGFFSVLVLTISVFSFHFMDLLPVAREILLEQMDVGVLVIDPKLRIVDLNPAILELFKHKNIQIGHQAEELFKNLGIETNPFENLEQSTVFEVDEPGIDKKFIEFKLNTLNKENLVLGWLGIFRDISEQRLASLAIENINLNLQSKLDQIQKLQHTLKEQAIRDPLTNVYNRRFFDEAFEKEMAHSKRSGKPLSIVMIDIDHFKRINDYYGHATGDQVLKNFGALLLTKTRASDVVCRYGGEEFIILVSEADADCLFNRADEIRKDFRNMCLQDTDLQMDITISIGVACYPQHGDEIRELTLKADQALYDAKENGRNQVSIAH